jgi:hypothetical protein
VDDLHHDPRDGTGFDPRRRSRTKHACRCSGPEGEVGGVWRVIVGVKPGVKADVRGHSLDELDVVQSQFGPGFCATTVDTAAPWVNASVLEIPFPSLAWVTRRITAKNWPALKVSWALKVG